MANEGCEAFGITSGPDGNLWFTEGAADTTDTIGRLTPAGSFTAFPLPTDGSDGSRPRSTAAAEHKAGGSSVGLALLPRQAAGWKQLLAMTCPITIMGRKRCRCGT